MADFTINVAIGGAGSNVTATVCIAGAVCVSGNGSSHKEAVNNALQSLDNAVAALKVQVAKAG